MPEKLPIDENQHEQGLRTKQQHKSARLLAPIILGVATALSMVDGNAFAQEKSAPSMPFQREVINALRRLGISTMLIVVNNKIVEVSMHSSGNSISVTAENGTPLSSEDMNDALKKVSTTTSKEMEDILKQVLAKRNESVEMQMAEALAQKEIDESLGTLKSEFGLNIVYKDTGRFLLSHGFKDIKPDVNQYPISNLVSIAGTLKILVENFNTAYLGVPNEVIKDTIKKAGIKKAYLVPELVDKSGDGIGGFISGNGDIVMRISDDIAGTFNHELVHALNRVGTSFPAASQRIWANVNPNGMKFYTFGSGLQAIHNQDKWVNDVTGSALLYGKNGGVEEDEACLGEQLLSSNYIEILNIITRARKDIVLWKKILMETGCIIGDQTESPFQECLTESEYSKRTGFQGYRFYPLWFKQNGQVVMDQEFWNERARSAWDKKNAVALERQKEEEEDREYMRRRDEMVRRSRENSNDEVDLSNLRWSPGLPPLWTFPAKTDAPILNTIPLQK